MRLFVMALTLGFMPVLFAQTPAASGQSVVPEVQNAIAPAPAIPPAKNAVVSTAVIPLKTPILFALDTAISSRTAVVGSRFQLKVVDDLIIDDVIVIPAGTPATGEIIHAQKSSVFGKAGELLLTIRYIDLHGQKIKMRAFQPYQGKDITNTALGASLAIGMFAAFIRGGEVVMPEKTLVQALVAAETSVDLTANTAMSRSPSPAVTGAQTINDGSIPLSDSATLPTGDSQ